MSNATTNKRVVFCTYPSIYSSLVLKKLLDAEGIDVVAIINSTRVLSSEYGVIQAALKQIRLSGWRYSTYLFWVTDFFTLLSSLSSVLRYTRLRTVKAYAKQNDIPIVDTPDINSQPVVDFITSQKPNVLLAAHFNQLVKVPILDSLGFSCINIHPSLLPDYKGVDPVFYALLNNEKHLGVSLHEMVEIFDTGKILNQKAISNNRGSSVYEYNCWLFEAGAELAIEFIKNKNQLEGKSQNGGNYDSWPSSSLVGKFKRAGHKLIAIKELLLK